MQYELQTISSALARSLPLPSILLSLSPSSMSSVKQSLCKQLKHTHTQSDNSQAAAQTKINFCNSNWILPQQIERMLHNTIYVFDYICLPPSPTPSVSVCVCAAKKTLSLSKNLLRKFLPQRRRCCKKLQPVLCLASALWVSFLVPGKLPACLLAW